MNLHRLAISSATHHPQRLAVEGPEGTMRYAELDQAANALANQLAEKGVGLGDRVVIWSEKSCAVVVAMQAVLRLGAVYVPQDDSVPAARVAMVIRDCAAEVVCTTRNRVSAVAQDAQVVCLDEPFEGDASPIDRAVGPDDLAYILYTSGSTGTPKGVCITHGNARAFVDWAVAELHATVDDRFANHAPLTFDLSVLDLYAAFSAGASVHLVPSELAYAPAQLVQFLRRRQITVWYSVPSALILMARDGGLYSAPPPTELRAVLFAGEPFPIAHVRRLADWTNARLLNLYGPTETNVCTFHEVVSADLRRDRPVPIGRACSGDTVWAVRPDGRTAGPGEEGELVADGPTVMAGYWGHAAHAGPYRTGDVVRVLKNGAYDYVGRRDHMVKVRGHRIELGDAEAAFTAHPEVESAALIVIGEGMSARLVAFVVAAPGHDPSALALRRHCAQRLPTYMIADEFHFVAELPHTRNGKIDRTALKNQASAVISKEIP
ncbi:amino acid adenylation domain-containing protein [Streptomyces sp. NBC_01518]|uniref:amino acid adenylation domain-containing protein n=1 Tax=Streptomyces sp. NBC_01518 TaxID=2903891 RepID=UPI00386858A3